MKCDLCNKKATVHLTEIIDEQMTEMHLCEECAREKSVQMEQQFGLADLLAGLSDFSKKTQETEKVHLKCEKCGLSYDDFRKFGRLGCSSCYETFKTHLNTLLKKIHGANQHLGKKPKKLPYKEKEKSEDISEWKRLLQQAIQMEDFEEAAQLRDKIRSLEKESDS